MNVQFLNPFLEAANEVLKAEIGVEVQRGEISLQRSALTANEVTVLLNMIGQLQGVVLYGMSKATACMLVSKMLGEQITELDSLAQSGVAELGNVLTGRATIKLSEIGLQTDISPPTVIIGAGITVSTLDFPRLVVPIRFEDHSMEAHLALRLAEASSNQSHVPLVRGLGVRA
ncbi:MAG: chemotaxis protein CheX [Anaerolineales bacterium]|nr:chemotaxis protein CheX [Anaerolineales bacterium]